MAKLPVFTATLRRWLKAGVVELGFFAPTDTGTPQGGVASPLLANVALDGMERLFDAEWSDGRPKSPNYRKGCNKGVKLMRYADDFVVTAPTREVLETYVRPRLEHFLQERGLAFNEAKTRIVHIREGVNFLGFHLRQFGRREPKLLTVPQKANVLAHLRELRAYLERRFETDSVSLEQSPETDLSSRRSAARDTGESHLEAQKARRPDRHPRIPFVRWTHSEFA